MTGITQLSALELREAYRTREVSPVEVVDACAGQIARVDDELGAFNALCLDRARLEAQAAEQAFARGDAPGPLAGIPFGVKDLFDSEGVVTTYGSPMFADHVPAADAEAVRRARAAGAILVGKTQTHEFAWGISSVNTLLRTSRNPWAPDRISGGSSGGSAVALASHQIPLALGSDTGGSIRVPSAFCGIVGFKPTYGRISLAGVWPLARQPRPPRAHGTDARRRRPAVRGDRRPRPGDPATEDVPLADVDEALARGLEGHTRSASAPTSTRFRSHPTSPRSSTRLCGRSARSRPRVDEVGFPEAATVYETFGVDAAGRGALHPSRGRPLPGSGGRVRRGRPRPPRDGRARGHRRVPARRRRTTTAPGRVRARLPRSRPAPDAGSGRPAVRDRAGDGRPPRLADRVPPISS